jgi:hypothetical protein
MESTGSVAAVPSSSLGGGKKVANGKTKVQRTGSLQPSSIPMDEKESSSLSVLGENDISGALALSVINIKVSSPLEWVRFLWNHTNIPQLFTIHYNRTFHRMLSHCSVIPDKPREREGIRSDIFMHIVVFVDRHGKGMIVGRVKFRLWV